MQVQSFSECWAHLSRWFIPPNNLRSDSFVITQRSTQPFSTDHSSFLNPSALIFNQNIGNALMIGLSVVMLMWPKVMGLGLAPVFAS